MAILPNSTIYLKIWHQLVKSLKELLLKIYLQTIKEIVPSMKMRKSGCIVGISSLSGIIAFPYIGHYSTSKFAVTGKLLYFCPFHADAERAKFGARQRENEISTNLAKPCRSSCSNS